MSEIPQPIELDHDELILCWAALRFTRTICNDSSPEEDALIARLDAFHLTVNEALLVLTDEMETNK